MTSKSTETWNERVKERYANTFESTLGVEFKKYSDGYCEVELKVKPEHLNIGGSVHGGVIESILDIALSGAVTGTLLDTPQSCVTLQMNVNFLKAGSPDDVLTGFAEIIKRGRTISYVEGGIKNQNGKLIAKASGDWFIKSAN